MLFDKSGHWWGTRSPFLANYCLVITHTRADAVTDETKINKMKNDILIEHRSDEALDVMDVARTMVASGVGCNEEGFNGAFDGLHVGDLKDLIDESSSDEAEGKNKRQGYQG